MTLFMYSQWYWLCYDGSERLIIVVLSQALLMWGMPIGYFIYRIVVSGFSPVRYRWWHEVAHITVCMTLFLYSYSGYALQSYTQDAHIQQIFRKHNLFAIDRFLGILRKESPFTNMGICTHNHTGYVS